MPLTDYCHFFYEKKKSLIKAALIMKLSTIFILVSCLNVSAKVFSQKITLEVKKKPIEQVFKLIEKQSGYSFIYAQEQIKGVLPIELSIENAELTTVLSLIFKGIDLDYTISDKNIILKEREVQFLEPKLILPPPPFIVIGRILNSDGKPLEGASVIIKGTKKGVATLKDGTFSLEMPASGGTLIFSFVGLESVEQKVTKSENLAITLKAVDSKLDDFVVIGYGTVKKSDLTGAVSQLKVEGVSEKPYASFEQLIQGRVSGVQIQQANGGPGAGLSFLIRGGNSTSNNQPLIVLDGYPIDGGNGDLQTGGNNQAVATPPNNPLANLNPNEIENIEILKDASSTAIYGSRGANGVVLITTKRGKKGNDKLEFSYRTDASDVIKKLKVLGTSDFLNYANEAAVNGGVAKPYSDSIINVLSQINNNWQDQIFQQGISKDYQMSVSGGEGKTNYSLTGNYTDYEGVIKNSFFKKGGVRLNIDREVSSKFKISANVNANRSNTRLGANGISTGLSSSSAVASALLSQPFLSATNTAGDIDPSFDANPISMVNLLKDVYTNTIVFSNINASLKIDNYLSLKANIGGNYNQSLRQTYFPRGTFVGTSSNGYAYQNQDTRFNYLSEFTINYNRQIAKNNINAVFGQTYQKWNYDGLATSASFFPNDNLGFYSFQSAQSSGLTSTGHQEWSLASFLGRINYSFNNKYLLTLTGRSDGASRLAPEHKWAFFPSAALGWNIHNEKFMKNQNLISTWKIRGSYGLSGNQTVAIGATDQYLSSDLGVVGGAITRGYILNNIANPLLGWENTKQFNLGTELSILNNRITIEINAYKKTTSNLLISLPITSVSGFNNLTTNSGGVENNGIEFDFRAKILDNKFKWFFSANASFNQNKMVDMGVLGASGQIFGSSMLNSGGLLNQPINVAMVGYAIGSFYGYKIEGIYQNANEVASGPEKTTAKPGDFKFVDLNGDGIISALDRTIIGNANPKYIFGTNNDFEYKGISLSVFIQGSIGNQVANLNRFRLDALNGNAFNISQAAYDGRWTGEGTSNYYPRAKWTGGYFNTRFSDFLIEDGSFVRLKNVTLGYNFPMGKQKIIKSAKLFITGTNLFIITKYTGYDPEVNTNYNNPLTPGIDNGTYPQVKTYSLGINLKF
ncbi:MAG: TonB-dependent receptor [Bacteroidetes bacterium]|nr:TonB-dependent receptor [Bacteroidota bacterium]